MAKKKHHDFLKAVLHAFFPAFAAAAWGAWLGYMGGPARYSPGATPEYATMLSVLCFMFFFIFLWPALTLLLFLGRKIVRWASEPPAAEGEPSPDAGPVDVEYEAIPPVKDNR